MSTVTEAVEMLRKRSADEVAGVLRAAGVKGYRGNADSCPVAQWLQGETEAVGITVDGIWARGYGDDGPCTERATLPRSAQTFIKRFDQGGYDDLRAEGSA